MSTRYIDELFKQAQKDISEGNSEQVRSELWPKIKSAIREDTDLTMEKRRRLMLLIPECLDKQSSKKGEKSQLPLSIYDLLNRPRSAEEGPRWHLW